MPKKEGVALKKAPVKRLKEVIETVLPKGYISVLETISAKIKAAQTRAMTSVNRELIEVYRDIGKTIHEQQQTAKWGAAVVEKLATDLQRSFPGMRGFSSRNIWNMRDFHLSYASNTKLQAMTAEISWTHNVVILGKCKDSLEKEFYIKMTKKNGWTYRVLMNQISNKTYEKTMTAQTSFDKHLPENLRSEAKLAVKDDYAFGFIELADQHTEREMERALVNKIEDFLREVGDAYCFVKSQHRLEIGDQEFFIDILLYHRKLKALVAIELKVGAFMPEYLGKMQFYLSVLDETVRLEGENPSIGIIVCKEKNRKIVEFAMKGTTRAVNVASYHTVPELPKEMRDELPSPEQISRLLDRII